MTPSELQSFREQVMLPGLTLLNTLGGPKLSTQADRMLLTIAQQESACDARYQRLESGNAGPARGFWQFEKGGGVRGVMTHTATRHLARPLCDALRVDWNEAAIWRAMEGCDVLAAGFARLLLWSDPRALPAPTDAASDLAWNYYLAGWRPGKPHPDKWRGYWLASGKALSSDAQQAA